MWALLLPICKALANSHNFSCVANLLRRQARVTALQVKKQVKQVALSRRWQLAIRLGPQLTTEHKDTSLAESEVGRV